MIHGWCWFKNVYFFIHNKWSWFIVIHFSLNASSSFITFHCLAIMDKAHQSLFIFHSKYVYWKMFEIVLCVMSRVKAFMEIFISYDHDGDEQIQFCSLFWYVQHQFEILLYFLVLFPFISCLQSIHLFIKFVIWIFCTTFNGVVLYYHVVWLNLSLNL